MDQCNCKICKIEISNLKVQIMNLVSTKTKKKPTCGVINNKKPKRMTLNQLVSVVETIAINLNQLTTKVDNLAITVDNLAIRVDDLTTTMNNRFDAVEKRLDSLENRVTNLEIKVNKIDNRLSYLEQNVVMKDDLKKIFKSSAFKSTTK